MTLLDDDFLGYRLGIDDARVIAEVGCSMMVGGNILGVTRNIHEHKMAEAARCESANASS